MNMREWLSGRALPCQGKCREFESRLPLQIKKFSFMRTFLLSRVYFDISAKSKTKAFFKSSNETST